MYPENDIRSIVYRIPSDNKFSLIYKARCDMLDELESFFKFDMSTKHLKRRVKKLEEEIQELKRFVYPVYMAFDSMKIK